jgi:hypothetical protein
MSEHEHEINRVVLSGRLVSDLEVHELPMARRPASGPARVGVCAPTSLENLTFGPSCPYGRVTANSAPARLEPPGADTEGIGFYALAT